MNSFASKKFFLLSCAFITCSAFAEKGFVIITESSSQNHIHTSKRNLPLVEISENNVQVNPSFALLSEHLSDLASYSYDLGKAITSSNYRPGMPDHLRDAGWQNAETFSGVRGAFFNDPNAGFVSYNPKNKTIAVLWHGSINGADWLTNANATKSDNEQYALPVKGMVHSGFAQKYTYADKGISAREGMLSAVRSVLGDLSADEKKDLQIFVSGHSQGGAMATLATADLVELMKEFYGQDYDNAKSNRVQAWLLSAARTFDKTAANEFEVLVGKHNVIRQSTLHDPVPNIALGDTGHELLSMIPFVGTKIADSIAGYASVGNLALESTSYTIFEALKMHAYNIFERIKAGDVGAFSMGLNSVNSTGKAFATFGAANHLAVERTFNPNLLGASTKRLVEALEAGRDHKKNQAKINLEDGAEANLATQIVNKMPLPEIVRTTIKKLINKSAIETMQSVYETTMSAVIKGTELAVAACSSLGSSLGSKASKLSGYATSFMSNWRF